MLSLEDSFSDILGKALRGTKISPSEAAEKAGVSPAAVQQLLDGQLFPAVLQQVAPTLGLHAPSLLAVAQKQYRPAPQEIEGFAQFTTPFDDMLVNAYLAWDATSREAVVFDTGADVSDILDFTKARGLTIKLILITHTHGDHIFDLDRLKEKTGAPAYMGDREPLDGATPFPAGQSFSVGPLQIASRLTWGHAKGGITYVITGLERPVAVVGDALFAGSMGGGMISYADALRTNETEIFSLADETIVAPGHGPLTTVGEERQHNPFFAGRV